MSLKLEKLNKFQSLKDLNEKTLEEKISLEVENLKADVYYKMDKLSDKNKLQQIKMREEENSDKID